MASWGAGDYDRRRSWVGIAWSEVAMVQVLLVVCVILLIVIIALLAMALSRRPVVDLSAVDVALRSIGEGYDKTERAVREEIARNRQEMASAGKSSREELGGSLGAFSESMLGAMKLMAEAQRQQLESFSAALARLTESNRQQMEALKVAMEAKLKSLQDENARQLEQMRATVDEKLQGTLERRLGEAFGQVSQRLEAVSRGLGEMQTLAAGVGDLKRVLTNVKTRGTWGEGRLEAMLAEVLTAEQYQSNVDVRGVGTRVEFAIRLPGRNEDQMPVWLPIDAKFPAEDYQRLLDAQERADAAATEEAGRRLENRVKACAWEISEKYVHPPKTTDFAILFVPFEGLFAEILRRPGLSEYVQRECKVMIAGPTTLWAVLSSLQMGFRTLAIQQRSSEVWNLLAAVKTEWSKYGEVLENVRKKLQQATSQIDQVHVRNRAIARTLRGVEQLSPAESQALLPPVESEQEAGAGAGADVEG